MKRLAFFLLAGTALTAPARAQQVFPPATFQSLNVIGSTTLGGKTLSLGGNFSTSGAGAVQFVTPGTTAQFIFPPASDTIIGATATQTLSNKSLVLSTANTATLLLGQAGTSGVVQAVTLGSGITLTNGTLTASGGGGGGVSSIVAGPGLAGGTITAAGTISLGSLGAHTLLMNTGNTSLVPVATPFSTELTDAGGTLGVSGTLTGKTLAGTTTVSGPVSLGGTVGVVGQSWESGAGSAGTWTTAIPASDTGHLLGATGVLGQSAAVTVGTGLALSGETLSNAGVLTFDTRSGAVTLGSADVTGALGYVPANRAGDTFSGLTTFAGGISVTAASTISAAATLSGGVTIAGAVTLGGTAGLSGQVAQSTGTGAAWVTEIPATNAILAGTNTLGAAGTATIGSGLFYNNITHALSIGTSVTTDVSASTYEAFGTGSTSRTVPSHQLDTGVYVTDYSAVSDEYDCEDTGGTITAGSNLLTLNSCGTLNAYYASAGSGTYPHNSIWVGGAGSVSTVGSITAASMVSPGESDEPWIASAYSPSGVYANQGGADFVNTLTNEVVNLANWTLETTGSGCTTGTYTLPTGATGNTPAVVSLVASGGTLTLSGGSITQAGAYIGTTPGSSFNVSYANSGPTVLTLAAGTGSCTTYPTVVPHFGVLAVAPTQKVINGNTLNTAIFSNGWVVGGTTIEFYTEGTVFSTPSANATVTPGTNGLLTTISAINGNVITLAANAVNTPSGTINFVAGTDNYAAFNATQNAGRNNGSGNNIRTVNIPPGAGPIAGGGYWISHGISVGSAQTWTGTGNWYGAGSSSDFSKGTWIVSTDEGSPTFSLHQDGASVKGLNVARPVPANYTSAGWTPIMTFPYEIDIGSKRNRVENVSLSTVTRGLSFSSKSTISDQVYNSQIYALVDNVGLFGGSGDAITVENLGHRVPSYGGTNADTWIANNHITYLSGYQDNAYFLNTDSAGGIIGTLFYNEKTSAGSLIHSQQNARWSDFGCQGVQRCVDLNDPGVVISANMDGWNLQDATTLDLAPFVSLASNSVAVVFDGLQMEHIDGAVFVVGSGDTLESPGGGKSYVGVTGGQQVGTWGQTSLTPFGYVNGFATLDIRMAMNRLGGGLSAGQPAGTTSAGGTLIFNGNPAPNAQWGYLTPTITSCGTATISGNYAHHVVVITGGAITTCTLNPGGTLSANAVLSIQPHQAGQVWPGASTTTAEILTFGTATSAGTFDVFGG